MYIDKYLILFKSFRLKSCTVKFWQPSLLLPCNESTTPNTEKKILLWMKTCKGQINRLPPQRRFTDVLGAFQKHLWALKSRGGGLLGQVPDRDAQHRPSTRNATRVKKKGGRDYTFCLIFMRNKGRNTTFSPFLLKYRGRNYTNFLETWKRGVEMVEHM